MSTSSTPFSSGGREEPSLLYRAISEDNSTSNLLCFLRHVLRLCCVAGFFIEQVEQETALLKETVEGAAKVLAEASATTETATRTFEQASVTWRGRTVSPSPCLLHVTCCSCKIDYYHTRSSSGPESLFTFLYALILYSAQTKKYGQLATAVRACFYRDWCAAQAAGFPTGPP